MTIQIVNFAEWAESQFAALCDEHGAVRNKAHQDQMGWDYVVEFAGKSQPTLPLDHQPGAATARVQIKSKTGGKPTTELKLSNAMRFCKESDPCFVVLFWRSKDGLVQRCFAREFDADLMAVILRRAREADRDGVDQLHKVRLSVPYADGDEHSSDLLPWIEARANVDGASYAALKKELNAKLGYEEHTHTGTITFAMDDIEAVLENSIGLRPEAPIMWSELRDTRFNIPSRSPLFSEQPTSFSMTVEPTRATITIKGLKGVRLSFSGDYRASAIPGLPSEFSRASFISKNLRIVLRPNANLNLSYAFESDLLQPLEEAIRQIAFFRLAGKRITVLIEAEGYQSLESLPCKLPARKDPWIRWFEHVLTHLHTFVISGEQPYLSIDQLGEQHEEVEQFVAFGRDGNFNLKISNLAKGIDEVICKGTVYHLDTEIGDSVYQAIIMRPALENQRIAKDEMKIVFGDPVFLYRTVIKGRLSEHAQSLRDKFATLCGRLGPGYATINGGDVLASVRSGVSLT